MYHLAGHPNVIELVASFEVAAMLCVLVPLCIYSQWMMLESSLQVTRIRLNWPNRLRIDNPSATGQKQAVQMAH
jgi:hypothetical protein